MWLSGSWCWWHGIPVGQHYRAVRSRCQIWIYLICQDARPPSIHHGAVPVVNNHENAGRLVKRKYNIVLHSGLLIIRVMWLSGILGIGAGPPTTITTCTTLFCHSLAKNICICLKIGFDFEIDYWDGSVSTSPSLVKPITYKIDTCHFLVRHSALLG